MQTFICNLLLMLFVSQGVSRIRHSNKNSILEENRRKNERENSPKPSFNNVSMSQVSKMLDILVEKYDSRLRPELYGKATQVAVNISIRMLGPIDDSKEVLMFTCYLRYIWLFIFIKIHFYSLDNLGKISGCHSISTAI